MKRTKRERERGTAILITLIVIVALLGGGAVLVGMQLTSTRSTEVSRSGMSALYCAEAGLNAARPIVANNYSGWNAALAAGTEPAWLAHPTLNHDLDGGDTDNHFTITLKDNEDEGSLANDPSVDNDLQVWIVSTCTMYPENKKQVSELVRFNIGGTCYESQLGGCGGNNNSN
jgi:Tfp pilus assembly protein PilX